MKPLKKNNEEFIDADEILPSKKKILIIGGNPKLLNAIALASTHNTYALHKNVDSIEPTTLNDIKNDIKAELLNILEEEAEKSRKELEEAIVVLTNPRKEEIWVEPFFDATPSRRAKRIKEGKTKKKGSHTHNKYAKRNKF